MFEEHENFTTEQEQLLLAQFASIDDLYFDILSLPFQSCEEEISSILNSESHDSEGTRHVLFPQSSLEILNKHKNRFRRLNGKKIAIGSPVYQQTRSSTNNIIHFAAEKFVEPTSQLSVLSDPYASSLLEDFSDEDSKNVQLVMYLLSSAEKVGEKHYDRAMKLLNMCEKLSIGKNNSVQRLVYYFTEALYEKIDRETGRITPKGLGNKQFLDEDLLMTPNPTILAFHELVPLSHVTKFAGIQAIIERVAEAKKVHIIDFDICTGVQFTILMQALEGQLDHLKITAVGIKSKKGIIEETGKRLENFANSLNLSFSFNLIMVSDILELNESRFELDEDETIAVYAAYVFKNMIGEPDRLEHLMKMIKIINPCIMVVTEAEATDNSPVFVDRFVEALFFYGAFFDSMEDCMKNDELNRQIAEERIFSPAIRNIVAAEGDERKIRHVSIDVWRAFFARFGMREVELSMSSTYQANLVLESFTCGGSCTLDTNGKSLIIGWKGTSLNSLSAWRFQ
ncbi:hypothetical protein BUALT_Bualt14G0124500 [Buddleja alternifolia]|uniref:Uncharacterized protein n=1 Tax=Buddleja alternifolia TaxID=168488 RepID=A0AAV6WH94_9LAMI|nr:hypothetical protein BUALT_Bualt14G0124500 [Buddleja alternifolia]